MYPGSGSGSKLFEPRLGRLRLRLRLSVFEPVDNINYELYVEICEIGVSERQKSAVLFGGDIRRKYKRENKKDKNQKVLIINEFIFDITVKIQYHLYFKSFFILILTIIYNNDYHYN